MKPLLQLALIFCVCLAPQTSALAQTFSNGNAIDVQGGERCATVDAGPANLARAPEDMTPWLEPYQESGTNTAAAGAKANTRVIPVAFHIIYRTDGVGNISNAEINAQLDRLNAGYGLSQYYSFSLDRITRTQNNAWYDDMRQGSANETNMKNALAVNPATTLNFYITRTKNPTGGAVLGFARYPWDPNNESSKMHGVVVMNYSLPGGLNENSQYNDGDTGVHEVGHFMGLYHTFEGYSCSGSGDFVSDTPAHKTENFFCDSNSDTCPSVPLKDPIHNYMNYTPDACMTQFTNGQVARIDWAMQTYRPTMSALYLTLSGDTYLPQGLTGQWSASAKGGSGSSYTFKWSYCPDNGTCSVVRTVTKSTSSDTYSRTAGSTSFLIRAEVTRGSETRSKDIHVDVCTGSNCNPLPKVSKPAIASASDLADAELATGSLPEVCVLDQNYPNPFNPSTEIRFALPEATDVRLAVYDALGREVARLVDGPLGSGYQHARFDASGLPSGVYLYRLETGSFQQTNRMVLLK